MIGYILMIGIPILIQALLIIHVIKNGKSTFWIYILIFLPAAGGIAYFFVEVLPDLRTGHHVARVGDKIASSVDPGRNIRRLEAELAASDTFENRKKLSAACFQAGDTDRAEILARECLSGVFRNDREILTLLASILTEKGRFSDSLEIQQKLKTLYGYPDRGDDAVLYGKTLAGAGDPSGAEEAYRKGSVTGSPFEALCLLADLYDNQGKTEEARSARETVVRKWEKLPRNRKKEERYWVRKAKEVL
jgi:hypothetical protein